MPIVAQAIDELVVAMAAEVATGPAVHRPSRFWAEWAELNAHQIAMSGFDEFKRTINQNYFTFVPSPRDAQFLAVARSWLRRPTPYILLARMIDAAPIEAIRGKSHIRRSRRLAYTYYVALLWEFARRRDHLGLLDRLDEPTLGHPIAVRYRGHLLSEDLSNSVLELNSLTADGRLQLPDSVLEVGGGYGRLGWAYLGARPDGRYIAVDIAPALAVAQEYLTRLYPGLPAFRYRHFNRSDEVLEEFAAARLAFLTPNQLELLPPLAVDAFVNVSSLHEMRRDQIARYFELADRHIAGRFYFKQWKRSVNQPDGVIIEQGEYPIPAGWRLIFSRTPHVQKAFFEELYLTRG